MKASCLLFFLTAPAAAQPFGFGIKGGLPMNDFLSVARNQNFSFSAKTNRYIIGPMGELRLPAGFGIELDILYRHFGYNGSGFSQILNIISSSQTTANAWEFPLVAKYKFKAPLIRPYVEAGVSWDKLSGLTQTVTSTIASVTTSSTTSSPPELNKDVTRGFVIGGGIDFKALVIHIMPEIRYTRWGAKHFIDLNGLVNSNQSQAEFLVGITF